ncbi:MAG: hypothetical protein IKY06_09455, partial [Clostridia bacterium]|nr:hypothetical protein [Clostridia bacterium]
MLTLYDLTAEYKTEPLGLDEAQPRFSWKLRSDIPNTAQNAFRLTVSGGGEVWDTGKVESGQSIIIEYAGAGLKPCTQYEWRVT